jgi:hypothetical protein
MIAAVLASLYSQAGAQAPLAGSLFPPGKQQALEGALSFYYFDYHEGLTLPLKSAEIGWVPGLHATWSRNGTSPALFGRAGVDLTLANTTYDGSFQDASGNVYPYQGTTKNTMVNAFGNIGITFSNLSNPPRTLTAYTGIGYHFWNRGVAGSGGYREYYAWKYVPVGLRMDYRANSELTGAVEASAKIMFGGTIKVFLSDVDPALGNINMDLGNRPGWRVEAPLYYQIWSLTPWFEYSGIGKSNTVPLVINGLPSDSVAAYEPSSTTHQFGLKVGARVQF